MTGVALVVDEPVVGQMTFTASSHSITSHVAVISTKECPNRTWVIGAETSSSRTDVSSAVEASATEVVFEVTGVDEAAEASECTTEVAAEEGIAEAGSKMDTIRVLEARFSIITEEAVDPEEVT
jgi:hypothetical protein